jgi:AraC family transcriptional regulator of adaptative response/methylated-DNA-[protein]-cysteine methyltransferase
MLQHVPIASMTDERRWAAVLARDASVDGSFFYAVTSTGVFCRPSCPSRRPQRDRVRFFESAAAAQQAGFRPCRRCQPTASWTGVAAPIARAAAYLARHVDEPVRLSRLAEIAALSPSHLQRQFTRALGVSPREYQAALRANRFRQSLRQGFDVTHAMYDAGYGSPSRVYEAAPTGRGVAPSRYKRGAEGLEISYVIASSPLGRVLVAGTDKGVCAVRLGADAAALERELREEFPGATLKLDRKRTGGWVRAILERLDGFATPLDLPLDVRGTAFQWRVWQALRNIPFGETRSYEEIARTIGQPRAVRAVARACAANPVAVVVPCHRAVPKRGGSGGYRWGAERKRRLLDIESA